VGLPQIVAEVEEVLPGERIAAYVGGLHLMHATDDEVRDVAACVRRHGIGRIICGHCTGEAAISVIADELQEYLDKEQAKAAAAATGREVPSVG
jgi:7,8-dihydropterin-6-yl-methyl-4-(beta-D-ribofuranosyl)aminobenzene 5'-phosphate synthase